MHTSGMHGGWKRKQAPVHSARFTVIIFFADLKQNHMGQYRDLVEFDEMLEREQPNTKIRSKLYVSRSRKRIADLMPEECQDAE